MTFIDDPQAGQRMGGWQWDGTQWQCVHPPGPGGPWPPQPDRPVNGPVIGVTDGSVAKRGEVGEFLSNPTTVAVNTNAGSVNYTVSAIVLPPGDWDVEALTFFQNASLDGAWIELDPLPAGVSGNMFAWMPALTTGGEYGGSITSPRVRAALAQPTLLPFTVNITNAQALSGFPAPYFTLTVTARRQR